MELHHFYSNYTFTRIKAAHSAADRRRKKCCHNIISCLTDSGLSLYNVRDNQFRSTHESKGIYKTSRKRKSTLQSAGQRFQCSVYNSEDRRFHIPYIAIRYVEDFLLEVFNHFNNSRYKH